jgi:hypothetical protein
MASRFKQEPRDIADLVNWYDTNFLRAANRVRTMTPEQLATPVDFAGVFKMLAVFYLGFVNNHSVHHRGQLAAYLPPMGSKALRFTAAAPTNPGTAQAAAESLYVCHPNGVCGMRNPLFLGFRNSEFLASLGMT